MEYNKYNVGIVGYWFATNYGGVASYYSLYRKIEMLGYNPFLVENPYLKTSKEGLDTFSRSFFKSINTRISENYEIDNIKALNSVSDTFLLGSDQVLTVHSIRTYGKYFLLEFADNIKKKIAYSSSCGGDHLISDEKIVEYAKKMLNRFDDISVREYSAVDIVKNKIGIKAERVIDPIFFTPASEYKEIAKTSGLPDENNYLLSYVLDPSEDKKKCINEISECLGLNSKIALDGRKFTYEKNHGIMGMPEVTLPQLDFPQWLHYFSNASFVFTDSFHGAAMAIIMNKPFIVYGNYKRGFTRFETLTKLFNFNDRLIKDSNELDYSILNKIMEYSWINTIIAKEQQGGGRLAEKCTWKVP